VSGSLQLQEAMIKKGKTLAIAESCTAGLLSHLITKNSGSSMYFLGSIVTYSNELKHSILGVRQEDLKDFGAVSEVVVLQMLRGVFQVSSADYGIAISGIAGPLGGSESTPVGTVWIAVGEKTGREQARVLSFQGDRAAIIEQAAEVALNLLYKELF